MRAESDIEAFLEGCGPPVPPAALAVPRAQQLAAFLAARDDVGARLIETRHAEDGRSWVIVEADVDVGQQPVIDIRRQERVAFGFRPQDQDWPQVRALRPDFPYPLSHVFLQRGAEPAALCLSEEPWTEARRRCSPGRLLQRLRTWLIDTARGALHAADQALEPFLVAGGQMILPANMTLAGSPLPLLKGVEVSDARAAKPVYRLFPPDRAPAGAPTLLAAVFRLPVRTHGPLSIVETLGDLRALCQSDGFDFAAAFDTTVRGWISNGGLDALAALILEIPLARTADAAPEFLDRSAFLFDGRVRDIAVALDLWSNAGGGGPVLPALRNPERDGRNMAIATLNPHLEMTPQTAAAYNGYPAPTGLRLVSVGAGALGSQVATNLVRAGERFTHVVDDDILLPHNPARHAALDHRALGRAKAGIVADLLGGLDAAVDAPAALAIDILAPAARAEDLQTALGGAEVILDFAASVAVSRALDRDMASEARRMSAFLSPNGRDLVVLAEDASRLQRLESLEMAYYGALVDDPRLAGHLALAPSVRYARSCREVTARLPQAAVSLHAAIAADALRRAMLAPAAFAAVWRLDGDTFEVQRVAIEARPFREVQVGDWTLLLAPDLMETLFDQRRARAPRETGGVLLGDIDTARRRILLGRSVASPPDSDEQRASYARGAFGLNEALASAAAKTGGMLSYRGEWHAHPDGVGVKPSAPDLRLQAWLADGLAADGEPAVMLIAGDAEIGCLVGEAYAVLKL